MLRILSYFCLKIFEYKKTDAKHLFFYTSKNKSFVENLTFLKF